MTSRFLSAARVAACAAAACFLVALLTFGQLLDGYLQALYPVAWLGATGVPRALWFNVAGFVLPGALAALVASGLRGSLPAHAPLAARVGAWMVLMSATGFALQGLLPLDPSDLDSNASRAHSLAWMLWWVAFTPGAVMHVIGRMRIGRRRSDDGARMPWAMALPAVALAVLVAGCAALGGRIVAPAVAERIACAAWFGWLLLMAFGPVRRATVRGSSNALDAPRRDRR